MRKAARCQLTSLASNRKRPNRLDFTKQLAIDYRPGLQPSKSMFPIIDAELLFPAHRHTVPD